MTTALGNLAENTPILSVSAAISFATFFPLIWWVWASQVAYSMHYHKNDWFHRIVAFLNLLVFGTLSAFTKDFDIEAGFYLTKSDDIPPTDITFTLNFTNPAVVNVQRYRAERLPIDAARGISLVLALSRLVLLGQYLMVILHSRKRFPSLQLGLYRHLGALIFSAACYFVAFGVMMAVNPQTENIGANVARILLWYLPLLAEISVHYINSDFNEYTTYSSKIIYERASGFFTVILGTGLDKVTDGLQFLVGALDFGSYNVAWALCGAIVIVGEFSLYFEGNREGFHYNNKRLLTWFFLHCIFLICLMMTILSCALLIQYANLSRVVQDIITLFNNLVDTTAPFPLQASEFPQAQQAFSRLGLPFDALIADVNTATTNLTAPFQNLLFCQDLLLVIAIAYQEFEAYPDSNDPLAIRIDEFFSQERPTSSDQQNLLDIVVALARSRTDEVEWFFGVAGGTILMLVVLNLVKSWPKNKFQWARLVSMVFSGTAFMLGSFINIGRNRQFSVQNSGSKFEFSLPAIWSFTDSSWIVPAFAALLTLQIGFNLSLRWFAGRTRTRPQSRPMDLVLLRGFEKKLVTRSPEESPFADIPVSLPRLSDDSEREQLTSNNRPEISEI
ncbi:hypothetical protein SISSUDRAFT_724900 [Sistotremastrum suecicum HHB10207 ss-3]|uniref:Uncharacterized protein n=1 Tax=Sistotremastrum suecicum HHB10207 ss-3 TaxID=1314776 RepID=A0A166DJA1_9AGAM|nr:hypothetical protein SISSUDRAFT_724900 [Sistotremastrum suecicum HHB10207 ss-3]